MKTHSNRVLERLNALQDLSVEFMSPRHIRDTLWLIVNKAVDLFECDGGSLYLKQDEDHLVFEVAVNRSSQVDFIRSSISVRNAGLAAFVYRTGEPLNIPDVHKIPEDEVYCFDDSFDRATGYRTRSVLIQPLVSSKGEKLGVLQLINRKKSRDQRWPSEDPKTLTKMPNFTKEDVRLLQSFASVASSAIENAQLQKDIENLFEGFVTAAVHAIEARDPTTRGHSDRVALLTVDLAENVSRSDFPEVRGIRFTPEQIDEIRYAALLHDFGKIGVRESTLQKEEKLSPMQKLEIAGRMTEFKHSAEIRALREYVQLLLKEGRSPNELEFSRIEKRIREFTSKIEEYWQQIQNLNRPTVVDEKQSKLLEELSHVHCGDSHGHNIPLLKKEEIFCLDIRRGSLTEEERQEIESHVTHTYAFLKKIPWTKNFARIPEIAGAHHEKLTGKGYPRKLKGSEIPLQSRMMTICDIYDALVASDRPYKAALPPERALKILEDEVKMGNIDERFLKVFLESKTYEHPRFLELQRKVSRKKAA